MWYVDGKEYSESTLQRVPHCAGQWTRDVLQVVFHNGEVLRDYGAGTGAARRWAAACWAASAGVMGLWICGRVGSDGCWSGTPSYCIAPGTDAARILEELGGDLDSVDQLHSQGMELAEVAADEEWEELMGPADPLNEDDIAEMFGDFPEPGDSDMPAAQAGVRRLCNARSAHSPATRCAV